MRLKEKPEYLVHLFCLHVYNKILINDSNKFEMTITGFNK